MFDYYATYEYYVSAALLVCAMFGMGNTLTPHQFLRVVRAPQGIVLIVVLQSVVAPCLAIAMSRLLGLPSGIAIGMLLVAALPGGLFSNVLTFLGRGNVALSVSATALCTLGSLVMTTLILKTFGSAQLPSDFTMPVGHILFEISFCLLLPLVVGMVIRRLFPSHHSTIANWCTKFSMVLLAVIIVGAMSAGRIQVSSYDWRSLIALAIYPILLLWVAYAIGLICKLKRADLLTVGIETVVRNSHLGVLLKASLFPVEKGQFLGDAVLFVILFYGGMSLVIGGVEVIVMKRRWGVFRLVSDG